MPTPPQLPPRFFEIVERDHDVQNPTSREKIEFLGERLRLARGARVLDLACGRGGPALILAARYGCRITGVELREAFVSAARLRVRDAALSSLVELVHADAREYPVEPASYDVAMCLGATFVWGGLVGTLAALVPGVRPGGHVVVGEPYWRTWPLPDGYPGAEEPFTTLPGTVERLDAAGLPLVALIASSEDDWDRYESLHWRAAEEWLEEHPDDADADAVRRVHRAFRDRYLRWNRELLGWAVFACRLPKERAAVG